MKSSSAPRTPRKRSRTLVLLRRTLWLGTAATAVLVLTLLLRAEPQMLSRLGKADLSALGPRLLLVGLLGLLALGLTRERLSRVLESSWVWALGALMVVGAFAYRTDISQAGQRLMAAAVPVAPSSPTTLAASIPRTDKRTATDPVITGSIRPHARMVEIERSRAGEFGISAFVNGAKVQTVLDTGASRVILTPEAARAAGLPVEFLDYSVQVETANGRTRAAPVTLDRLAVGRVVERSVPALIAQPGQLKVSLLGMSFLDRLESWEVRGETLRMRGFP